MASAQDIAAVQASIPSWAATLPALPWDNTQIGTVLDAIGSAPINGYSYNGYTGANWYKINRAIRLFWVQRVSDLSALTDVHDANSTRPLSQSYDHAVAMLNYWDRYLESSHETRNGKIRKRHRRRGPGILVGMDPFGFGSPYARTD